MKPSSGKPEPRSSSVPGSGVALVGGGPNVPEPTGLNPAGGSPPTLVMLPRLHAGGLEKLQVNAASCTSMLALPVPMPENTPLPEYVAVPIMKSPLVFSTTDVQSTLPVMVPTPPVAVSEYASAGPVMSQVLTLLTWLANVPVRELSLAKEYVPTGVPLKEIAPVTGLPAVQVPVNGHAPTSMARLLVPTMLVNKIPLGLVLAPKLTLTVPPIADRHAKPNTTNTHRRTTVFAVRTFKPLPFVRPENTQR